MYLTQAVSCSNDLDYQLNWQHQQDLGTCFGTVFDAFNDVAELLISFTMDLILSSDLPLWLSSWG